MKNKTKRVIGVTMLSLPLVALCGSIVYYLGWKDGLSIIGVSVLLCGYVYLAMEFAFTPKNNS